MTKDLFIRLARDMAERLADMPDDLWGSGYPAISVRVGNDVVFVGIREHGSDEEAIEAGDG